jgi:hypothetical protein
MLILTTEQAALVRGPTSPASRLEPVPLADGKTYVLPEDVLDDPAHAARRDLLAGLPRRAIADDEWPAADR